MTISLRKCVFLVGALCVSLTITTIMYGQYYDLNFFHDRLANSQDTEFDNIWTRDEELWDNTTATGEEKLEGLCPLRKAVKKDDFFRLRFNFKVPVLQWTGSFSHSEWGRLEKYMPPYGWKDLPQDVVRSTLALLNDSSSSRLFERRWPDQCVRCAVVGNGGILRGSKQGRAIDSHHFVFRVNGAITKHFEEDVGTKTSFYGFTTNTMKNSLKFYRKDGFTKVPRGRRGRYIFIPSNERDYVMMSAAIQGLTVTSGHDKGDWPSQYFGFKPPVQHFKMLHPDFITYVTQRFLKSPLLKYSQLYMPSTGALMLLTALHMCDQVSAYGFITKNFADFSDHYYDAVKQPLRFYANHDMQMESWLWEVLHAQKVMSLYKRTKEK
ncbi:alpha-N-acetylgalactosaminide alpha-2,6-sialyltransferase 2 isoform X1 [Coregonus clupeaformis]|uniref:alpha-N-acetylgalactosaminide alpha-2,6-sialyltransferase 2 isoform X1 n=1 Tax=Coregonus clupeaformis TaxID=59861 RepID=UPI001E1C2995|nr:alpha-N-acetylgalactosaminide alpha-2,6-sialyltransferase 2 isoform X1 [Coregonus clupeaformis]